MKSNTLKRLLALVLALVLCLGLIACSATTEETAKTDDTAKSDDSTSTTTPADTTTEETVNYWDLLDSVSDSSELPDWTGETLEVNVWIAGGTDASFGIVSDDNVVLKEFERVTGVKFNVDECYGNNGETIDAVMPRIITGGDLPTVIAGWNIGSQMRELYDNGYLADLTGYYDNGDLSWVEYWADMDKYDDVLWADARTEDGTYYLIPQGQRQMNYYGQIDPEIAEFDIEYYNMYGATPTNASGLNWSNILYVRDDILQALYPDAKSMDEIKELYVANGTFTEEEIYDVELNSAEDFYEMLYAIKELLASGDYTSLAGGEVEVTYGPNSETDNWNWMYYLPQTVNGFASETDYFVAFDRTADDESSVLKRAIDLPQYKDWMQNLNKLVNDDVISQNSLVDNSATFNEKLTNGNYAVIYGDTATVRACNVDGSEGGWSYRPVWVNTPIDETFGGISTGSSETYYGIFKDTLTDEQLDQFIHAINYSYSVVGQLNFMWGPASAGLFDTDESGNRYFTNEDVVANIFGGEDNGAAAKYGLRGNYGSESAFIPAPTSYAANILMAPKYVAASQNDRDAADAVKYFTPAILAGKSRAENATILNKDSHAYSYGMNFEDMQEFWTARTGFEDQMKKVMAATPDNFETAYQALITFCEENNLTAESIQEFNDNFVAVNHDILVSEGVLK